MRASLHEDPEPVWHGSPLQRKGERVRYGAVHIPDRGTFNVGDDVLMVSVRYQPPFIGRITSMWEDSSNGVMFVRTQWYWRPEDTALDYMSKRAEAIRSAAVEEATAARRAGSDDALLPVFYATSADDNEVTSILGHCSVRFETVGAKPKARVDAGVREEVGKSSTSSGTVSRKDAAATTSPDPPDSSDASATTASSSNRIASSLDGPTGAMDQEIDTARSGGSKRGSQSPLGDGLGPVSAAEEEGPRFVCRYVYYANSSQFKALTAAQARKFTQQYKRRQRGQPSPKPTRLSPTKGTADSPRRGQQLAAPVGKQPASRKRSRANKGGSTLDLRQAAGEQKKLRPGVAADAQGGDSDSDDSSSSDSDDGPKEPRIGEQYQVDPRSIPPLPSRPAAPEMVIKTEFQEQEPHVSSVTSSCVEPARPPLDTLRSTSGPIPAPVQVMMSFSECARLCPEVLERGMTIWIDARPAAEERIPARLVVEDSSSSSSSDSIEVSLFPAQGVIASQVGKKGSSDEDPLRRVVKARDVYLYVYFQRHSSLAPSSSMSSSAASSSSSSSVAVASSSGAAGGSSVSINRLAGLTVPSASPVWEPEEAAQFLSSFQKHGKDFEAISNELQNRKTVAQCVEYYYLHKTHLQLKTAHQKGYTEDWIEQILCRVCNTDCRTCRAMVCTRDKCKSVTCESCLESSMETTFDEARRVVGWECSRCVRRMCTGIGIKDINMQEQARIWAQIQSANSTPRNSPKKTSRNASSSSSSSSSSSARGRKSGSKGRARGGRS